ncbi:hypothetical protein [Paenibacillus sp. NPDC057967]|uniref:hypothetical protein n=1 Tax=Paenibacillus sp. NPDC057967 TaxID=3346293 RepID=UPI0036DAA5B5
MISYRRRVVRASIGLLAAMVMLSGCGAAKTVTGNTGSFGDAVVAEVGGDAVRENSVIGEKDGRSSEDRQASNSIENTQTAASGGNQQTEAKEQVKNEGKTNETTATLLDDDSTGTGSSQTGTKVGEKNEGTSNSGKSAGAGANVQTGAQPDSGKPELPSGASDNKGTTSVGQKTNQGTTVASDGSNGKGASGQGSSASSNGSNQEQPAKSGADGKSDAGAGKKPTSAGGSSGKYPQIGWNEFFDNEEQTTPSDRFWDLADDRKTVQIKGFMGEVLSFDQNWFLLIPEPGAECPFDNGDETYWNKIMIVFVKDGSKLRYTNKPLKLTGRLDVGVKVDESGYKTMFRLYDAKFEEIKE